MSTKDIPSFSGYTPAESIISFLEDLELYVAARGLNGPARKNLLIACLRGPAKNAFTQAETDGVTRGGFDPGADPVAYVNNAKVWLMKTYHTEDIRQGLKDQIATIFQGENESPAMFYNKIRHLIDLAGIPDNAKENTAENAFLNGINRELFMAIRLSPVTLDLAAKVNFANRYWTARH